ncbi:TPA: hypothetical protein I8412_001990 [Citrobacter freundii]|nr:hypothetical protein [Citrobacter freundii]HAT2227071.1 hypothetical protein [Citrobacter freundii]HAT2567350.1 hypothetical protein [Citrobacter freundii]HAT2588076.1 hypothetical protein [Citrobacter freundii]HAT3023455.1 hypothetical protein [Citrobacter freundii]
MRILLDTGVETSIQLQGLPSFFMDSKNYPPARVVTPQKSSLRSDVRNTFIMFLSRGDRKKTFVESSLVLVTKLHAMGFAAVLRAQ